jgi:hypothetical protein
MPSSNTTIGCSRCSLQGEARARRLLEIKNDILHKLGLKQAPNVTMRELPRMPPVNTILGRYGLLSPEDESIENEEEESEDFGGERVTRGMATTENGMLSDYPSPPPSDSADNDDFEDFLINSEKSISLSRSRKFFLSILLVSNDH